MLSTFGAQHRGVLRWFGVVISWGVLLLLVSPPSGAENANDVCELRGRKLQTEGENGAAEIAKAYARTTSQLSLDGKARDKDGKVLDKEIKSACNWTCGSGTIPTPFIKAFGFLQYNCSSTTAPPSTRLPTGSNNKESQSQMGLSITDAEYRAATDNIFRSAPTGEGDLMRVPSWLKDASQDGDVKKLTRAVEANPGATWMKFSSTSVNNDEEGFDRVIIRVPDTNTPPRFEQWIQIAINKSTGKLGRNVDFLAVQRSPDSTSPLTNGPVVAFRGYSRTGFVAEGPGGSSSLSKCYSCHPSGLRAVIPAPSGAPLPGGASAIKPEGTIPLTGPGNITDITNEKTTRLSVFGPRGYAASQNGPPLGPETRPNRDQFVAKGCAKSLSKPRQDAIVRNMRCQACHDGETDRGILNAGTNIKTLRHKVVENTVAPMPPKEVSDSDPSLRLSPPEREVLFQCLQAEYADMVQEWLAADLGFPGPATWMSLGDAATSGPAVSLNASGGFVVFVRRTDNAIWYTSQTQAGGNWSPWQPLGGIAMGSPAAALSQDGRLHVFVRGTDQAIWTREQATPNGQWSAWVSVGGGATSDPAAAVSASGGPVVFVRRADNAIWHTSQTQAGGNWSPWQSLGGIATNSPAATLSQDGRFHVFVRGTDQAIWTRGQARANGDWSEWKSLRGVATSDPAVALSASGGLVVFVRGTDNAIWHTSQAQADASWYPWRSLGGIATSSPAAALSQDRRLHVFVRWTDNAIWDGGT